MRGENGFAGGDPEDCGDDLGGGGVLEEVAGGAGSEGGEEVGVGAEGREDEDFGGIGMPADLGGGGDAVEDGHADVHQDDVGVKVADGVDCLTAVGCLADELHRRGSAEHAGQTGSDERVVVHQEQPDGRTHAVIVGSTAARPPTGTRHPGRPVLDPATDQRSPLGEADQADMRSG